MKATALFGGTFNPIHLGHLRVAEEVRAGFALDEIRFIPSALPPHKQTGDLADAQDRYHMMTAATAGNPGFVVSDIEIERKGRSYTIDTVRHVKGLFPPSVTAYLIVGIDAFLEIETWKDYAELFDLIAFIVISRGAHGGALSDRREELADYIHAHVDGKYRFCVDGSRFVHARRQPICLFDVTALAISSTSIRNLVRKGASIKYLVPDPVETYIYEKGLYAHDSRRP